MFLLGLPVFAQSFPDVSPEHWAYESIEIMKEEEIIAGYPDGTFKPNGKIERQHVALLFTRTFTLENKYQPIDFKDVTKNHPYAKEIDQVARAGIFQGNGEGKFNPKGSLTRAEMAQVLTNALDLKVKATYDFIDVPENHWAKDAIRALYSNGITEGSGGGKYDPNGPVTRAQFAKFLYEALHVDPNFVAKPIVVPKEKEPTKHQLADFEKQVVELTNKERSKRGLGTLKVDVALSKVAYEKSRDMHVNNYFAHYSPTYGSLGEMMNYFEIPYRMVGENLAKGHQTPEQVVEAWMNSPGHRDNLLRKEYTHIGIGFFESGNHWTQLFLRE